MYYEHLHQASAYTMLVTPWMIFFLECLIEAQQEAMATIHFIVLKKRFWQTHEKVLNERQTKVMRRMFDAGVEGFKWGDECQEIYDLDGVFKGNGHA